MAFMRVQFPDVLVFAVPNGAALSGSAGQRAAKMAKLKAEGLVPGIPDLIIPSLRLCVEMKRVRGGVVSADQKGVHDLFTRIGWSVIVAKGADDAIAKLREHMREHA